MLIANATMKPLTKYMNKNILYAFIVTLDVDHEDIIIKFGYTEDLIDRYRTLKAECNKRTKR
jgi:hypothetical protein